MEKTTSEIAKDVPIPIRSAPVQSSVMPIPDGQQEFTFRIKRSTSLDPTVFPSKDSHIGVYVLISLDGQTWDFLTGFTTTGGIFLRQDGNEETENRHIISLDPDSPYAKANGRTLKVSFVSISGPMPDLTFSADVK